MRFYIALILSLFCLSLSAEVRDRSTGVSFPSDVTFDYEGQEYKLKATGVSTRKKFFVKVYSVASYLQEGALKGNTAQEIMSDKNAKQLTIKWVHDAPADKLQEGYRDSFRKVVRQGNLKKEVDTYVSFFSKGAKVGDEHILRWIPGGIVEVVINGNKAGTIKNKAFAEDLWEIWFGNNSVVNRSQLLSN